MVAPCAPAAYSVRREKLRKCHAAGEVLNALPINAVLTLAGYAKCKSSAKETLKTNQSSWPKPDGRYNIPWILRTKLLTELRAKGVTGLSYNSEDSIDVIANAFPDGNEWLKTFREGIDNIGDLVDTLH